MTFAEPEFLDGGFTTGGEKDGEGDGCSVGTPLLVGVRVAFASSEERIVVSVREEVLVEAALEDTNSSIRGIAPSCSAEAAMIKTEKHRMTHRKDAIPIFIL
eukprot:CAMPEP_0195520280 /NCGR_PEP_ID=MMETSP0794_2-20130614/16533_1 /TAXON_ID=515487 /ORGANISM="Stephanopyxis turris, Strain CCMP 815" /LENGTH=101 /DNA_ID=CAMNT_0040649605 /DNA_START=698 /DNA_END=1006 /DNA_ORIENTATION=+